MVNIIWTTEKKMLKYISCFLPKAPNKFTQTLKK